MQKTILQKVVDRARLENPREEIPDVYHALRVSKVPLLAAKTVFAIHASQTKSKRQSGRPDKPYHERVGEMMKKYEEHLTNTPGADFLLSESLTSQQNHEAQAALQNLIGGTTPLSGLSHPSSSAKSVFQGSGKTRRMK